MATYKVIQDIEAEDKLVGPFSLRQFIYGGIAATCGYLSFVSVTKNAGFLLIIFAPILIFTGFFAIPWGGDQSTEIWALAKVRFFLKPRRRIWDQSGTKDLVNITVPKRIERVYTNNLSQTEVHSRLYALADTLDSRGWAVKNVNTNLYDPTAQTAPTDSDRLIGLSSMPQEVSNVDITAQDDILDPLNNPTAQKLNQMVTDSTNQHRQRLVEQMNQLSSATPPAQPTPPQADYWFLNQPLEPPKLDNGNTAFTNTTVVAPGSEPAALPDQAATSSIDEAAVSKELKRRHHEGLGAVNSHMKTVVPLGEASPQPTSANPPQAPPAAAMTPQPNPDKIRLAGNDDLTVATIQRLANKPEEVVISLHDRTP